MSRTKVFFMTLTIEIATPSHDTSGKAFDDLRTFKDALWKFSEGKDIFGRNLFADLPLTKLNLPLRLVGFKDEETIFPMPRGRDRMPQIICVGDIRNFILVVSPNCTQTAVARKFFDFASGTSFSPKDFTIIKTKINIPLNSMEVVAVKIDFNPFLWIGRYQDRIAFGPLLSYLQYWYSK